METPWVLEGQAQRAGLKREAQWGTRTGGYRKCEPPCEQLGSGSVSCRARLRVWHASVLLRHGRVCGACIRACWWRPRRGRTSVSAVRNCAGGAHVRTGRGLTQLWCYPDAPSVDSLPGRRERRAGLPWPCAATSVGRGRRCPPRSRLRDRGSGGFSPSCSRSPRSPVPYQPLGPSGLRLEPLQAQGWAAWRSGSDESAAVIDCGARPNGSSRGSPPVCRLLEPLKALQP